MSGVRWGARHRETNALRAISSVVLELSRAVEHKLMSTCERQCSIHNGRRLCRRPPRVQQEASHSKEAWVQVHSRWLAHGQLTAWQRAKEAIKSPQPAQWRLARAASLLCHLMTIASGAGGGRRATPQTGSSLALCRGRRTAGRQRRRWSRPQTAGSCKRASGMGWAGRAVTAGAALPRVLCWNDARCAALSRRHGHIENDANCHATLLPCTPDMLARRHPLTCRGRHRWAPATASPAPGCRWHCPGS